MAAPSPKMLQIIDHSALRGKNPWDEEEYSFWQIALVIAPFVYSIIPSFVHARMPFSSCFIFSCSHSLLSLSFIHSFSNAFMCRFLCRSLRCSAAFPYPHATVASLISPMSLLFFSAQFFHSFAASYHPFLRLVLCTHHCINFLFMHSFMVTVGGTLNLQIED